MKIARLAQAAAIAALFAAGSASAVEMINNGDFEAYSNSVPGSGYTMVANGSTAITGWTIGGVSVDQIQGAYNAISGVSIDLLGTPGPGVISQSFNFAANTTYTLSFQLTHNPYAGGGAMMYADFFGNQYQYDGMQPLQTVTLNYTTGNTGGSTTLSFGSIGGDGYSGAVIDNVSVTAAVPEPETYAMLGLGLGLLAFIGRRKQKAAK
jgi:choice-of-anchor C domain-containing protein